jgi:hypothetical protein
VPALLLDAVDELDSQRVARAEADDVKVAAEGEGCDDADDESESALLRVAALLVDALPVAADDIDVVGDADVDIDTVLTNVAAGEGEIRGDTVVGVDAEAATDRVTVVSALTDRVDDGVCVGDTSGDSEMVPVNDTDGDTVAVGDRDLICDAELLSDDDGHADDVATAELETWLETVRLSVGIVGYDENVAVDDADVDAVALGASDSRDDGDTGELRLLEGVTRLDADADGDFDEEPVSVESADDGGVSLESALCDFVELVDDE